MKKIILAIFCLFAILSSTAKTFAYPIFACEVECREQLEWDVLMCWGERIADEIMCEDLSESETARQECLADVGLIYQVCLEAAEEKYAKCLAQCLVPRIPKTSPKWSWFKM